MVQVLMSYDIKVKGVARGGKDVARAGGGSWGARDTPL